MKHCSNTEDQNQSINERITLVNGLLSDDPVLTLLGHNR